MTGFSSADPSDGKIELSGSFCSLAQVFVSCPMAEQKNRTISGYNNTLWRLLHHFNTYQKSNTGPDSASDKWVHQIKEPIKVHQIKNQ